MKPMTGRLAAALIAALVVVPTAMANDDHGSKKKHDELEISVVSSPAKYVSGGDARIEIAVPDKTASRRRRRDAERRRRHLRLRAGPGATTARGRRHRPAARREHGRRQRPRPGHGEATATSSSS